MEKYVKILKSEFHCMYLFGFQACKFCKFSWKIYCEASLEIIFRQKYFPKAPVLIF